MIHSASADQAPELSANHLTGNADDEDDGECKISADQAPDLSANHLTGIADDEHGIDNSPPNDRTRGVGGNALGKLIPELDADALSCVEQAILREVACSERAHEEALDIAKAPRSQYRRAIASCNNLEKHLEKNRKGQLTNWARRMEESNIFQVLILLPCGISCGAVQPRRAEQTTWAAPRSATNGKGSDWN